MTPFDELITKYAYSKINDIVFIVEFLKFFRILHIDAAKIPFFPKRESNIHTEIDDTHIRMKLIFFEVITQLNLCGRLLKKTCRKNIPRLNEIRIFRNMCVEHYDDYIMELTSEVPSFLITRQNGGVFPCGEYGAGKIEPPLYPKIKSELESAIRDLTISVEQEKIEQLFTNFADDQARFVLYDLLAKSDDNKLKRKKLMHAIWNFGLPAPFSDTDQYFKNEFLPFVRQLLSESIS